MKRLLALATADTATIVTMYLGLGSLPVDQRIPMLVALSVLLMGTLKYIRNP